MKLKLALHGPAPFSGIFLRCFPNLVRRPGSLAGSGRDAAAANVISGRRKRSGPGTRAGGFTLLEILLVLTIVAMASVVVFPNITGLETRTFNARVREAHTLLNLARRTAVVSGQPGVAHFNMAVEDDREIEMPSPFTVGSWDGSGFELTFQDSADREVEIEDSVDITFYPEGGSTGGNLFLAFRERRASIAINPFTGRVETEFLDDQ